MDTTSRIRDIKRYGKSWMVRFALAKNHMKNLVPKGSITINGWLRDFLWSQASQVIQSYGSALSSSFNSTAKSELSSLDEFKFCVVDYDHYYLNSYNNLDGFSDRPASGAVNDSCS